MRHLGFVGLVSVIGCGVVAMLPVATAASDKERGGAQQERAWRMLRKLVGQWHASANGRDVRTDFRLIANGNYLLAETVSVSSSEEDVHRDCEIFSYDAGNKRVMVRQFVSEGVISRYRLDEISPDGKTLTFVTEHSEGGSPKFGARWTHGFASDNEYTTKLELSFDGKTYRPPCVDSRLQRVE